MEIIDRLYIGNIQVVYNKNFMKEIDIIVNCTKEKYTIECQKQNENKKIYVIPIDDTSIQNNIDTFVSVSKEILPQLINDYNVGHTILVHCSQGQQRSAAFVSIFLVYLLNISLEDAIQMVISKKPSVFSSGREINFIKALEILYKSK